MLPAQTLQTHFKEATVILRCNGGFSSSLHITLTIIMHFNKDSSNISVKITKAISDSLYSSIYNIMAVLLPPKNAYVCLCQRIDANGVDQVSADIHFCYT